MLLRIRRKRLELGKTIKAVATEVGCAAKILQRIEAGRERAWPRLRSALATLYATPEADLFGDVDAADRHLRRIAGEGTEKEG